MSECRQKSFWVTHIAGLAALNADETSATTHGAHIFFSIVRVHGAFPKLGASGTDRRAVLSRHVRNARYKCVLRTLCSYTICV